MRGEFTGVWSETWREIWAPLVDQSTEEADEPAAEDIVCDIYRELAKALKTKPSPGALAEIIGDPPRSRHALETTPATDLAGERAVVAFLEAVHDELDELGGDTLTNRYFNLLAAFIEKFSLRYDLRRPCILCPTLPGVFASLIRDLRALAAADPHLDELMRDFEDSIRDLRFDCNANRIKTCIMKQVNLMEGIGGRFPGVTATTLGAICDQLGTWPHEKLKEAMKSVYGFASDFPGTRHGGRPQNAIRAADMRDLLAMSVLLAGFTPYLSDQLNADAVYRGA